MKNDRFLDIDDALKHLQDSVNSLKETDTSSFSQKLTELRSGLYNEISRWESVEISRHPQRPVAQDYISSLFTDFIELHGDRIYEDDPAVIGGLAKIGGVSVVVVAHYKHSSEEKNYLEHHFGMASPSGHYKALRLYRLAEKFAKPVITFVDTPGAYPTPEAEYMGQAFSIAKCISTITSVKTPVIACMIGEAGSGGALALGFGDRMIMLENSFYSAISPEGYSSIKSGDASFREEAAETLKGSGHDIKSTGIIDCLIKEPVGGAHNDREKVIEELGLEIKRYLAELSSIPMEKLLLQRRHKIEKLIPSTMESQS